MATETRRHNGFGVDLTGSPENLDRAMVAINAHSDLLAACQKFVVIEGDRGGLCTYCGSHRTKCPSGCPLRMARAAIAKAQA